MADLAVAETSVYEDSDNGGALYVYICNLCGQPLFKADAECNSSLHVGPDGKTKGKAIKSTIYVNLKRDA